jgi:D-alanine--poly(phosphoribitol) ligase subunit 2
MSVSLEMVTTSVRRAIESFNASEAQKVPLDGGTVLLGQGGAVDSLGLVRLVLTVERQVRDDFGVGISLTDEKAMSQRNSPFRSIDSLVNYLSDALAATR